MEMAKARVGSAKRQKVVLPYQRGQNVQQNSAGPAYDNGGRLVRPPRAQLPAPRRAAPTIASSLHLDILAKAALEKHGIKINVLHPLFNMIEDANNIATRPAKRKGWLTRFVRSVYDALAEELAAVIGADEDEANGQGIVDDKTEGAIIPKRRSNRFALGLTHWSEMQEWRAVEARLPSALSGVERDRRDSINEEGAEGAEGADGAIELGDFLYELLCHKYGLKHLVDQKIWDLLITLHQHQEGSAELKSFAEFLAGKRPPSELAFLLHCRRKLQTKSEGAFVPDAGGSVDSDEHVDLVRATAFVSELFGSLWIDRVGLVAQRAVSLQRDGGRGGGLPPSYQSAVDVANRRAERTKSLLDLCLVQVTAAATDTADSGEIQASGGEHRWISVLELVEVLQGEAAAQLDELSAQKWAEQQFTMVDDNADQYISLQQFKRIFEGVRLPKTVSLGQLYTRGVRDEQAMAQMSRPQYDEACRGIMGRRPTPRGASPAAV
jgi:hypothetical protein